MASSATFYVDSPGKLTTLSSQVAAAGGGTHNIRFKTYAAVGTFSAVSGISADSLIFERDTASTETIELSGTFIRARGCNAKIIVRGLAFKLTGSGARVLNGSDLDPDSLNASATLDSLVLFGDSTSVAVDWKSKPGAAFRLSNSIISAMRTKANDGFQVSSDSVILDHNYINYPALFTLTTTSLIQLTFNTTSRAQFSLVGGGSGHHAVVGNFFSFPPQANRLPGGANFYPIRMSTDDYSSSTTPRNNARFSSWEAFDTPDNILGSSSTNLILAPFGDSLAQWSFPLSGDTVRGYSNPPSTSRFPRYNIFPGDTKYSIRLGNDSVEFAFPTAPIPRVISASLSSVQYPAFTDSTRTFWLKDSAITFSGLAQVQSLTLPQATALGKPLLFSGVSGVFSPSTMGAAGSLVFSNSTPTARTFIPSWAGQNTRKGRGVVVRATSGDTTVVVVFDSISRTGNTTFSPAAAPTLAMRQRAIQKSAASAGWNITTNATGTDSSRLGIGKTGLNILLADSILVIGGTPKPVRDSAGKYWIKTTFAPTIQAGIVERLAVGRGADTLAWSFGSVKTSTTNGHHLTLDTSFAFDTSKATTLARPAQGRRFTWLGRTGADSFSLRLIKAEPLQSAFAWNGAAAVPVTPSASDSNSVTVPLGVGDSVFPIFLARPYSIASKTLSAFSRGNDSVTGLFSNTPGDLIVDTLKTGLPASSDTLIFLTGRTLTFANLAITSPFQFTVPVAPDTGANLRALVRTDTNWNRVDVMLQGGKATVSLSQNVNAIAFMEFRPKPDTTKIVKAFSASPDTLFLNAQGPAGDFIATFEPSTSAQPLVLSSRDTTIATVSNGRVFGKSQGRTKIIVQVSGFPAFSDSIIAVVTAIDTTKPDTTKPDTTKPDTNKVLTAFAAKPDTLHLIVGGPTGELTAVFEPKELTQAITLTSRDTTIAKTQNGRVVPVKPGKTSIIVRVANAPAFADTITVFVTSPEKPDTLAVSPEYPPAINYTGETVSIKPNLSDSERVQLKGFVVTTTTLTLSGEVQVKTSTTLNPTATFTVVRDSKGFEQVTVTYEAMNGRKTMTTPFEIMPNLEGIKAALDSLSQPLTERVWHLMGFPRGGSIKTDIKAFQPSAELKINSGRQWIAPQDDSIGMGKAVLATWKDTAFKPVTPSNFAWSSKPDTVVLHPGWNLVSSPLPFGIAEEWIKFDDSEIGYFYGLEWEGSGYTAKPRWIQSDTLLPFRGYAVWANGETRLIFDIKRQLNAGSLLKQSTLPELKVTLKGATVGRYSYELREGRPQRISPRPSLGEEAAGIDWDSKVASRDTAGLRFIRVVSDGVSELDVSLVLPHGLTFEGLRMAVNSNGKYPLLKGENWFLLGTQSAIATFKGSKLNSDRNPKLNTKTGMTLTIPFESGTQRSVEIVLTTLAGQTLDKQTLRNVSPGEHPLSLKTFDGTPCAIRIRFGSGKVKPLSSLIYPGFTR
jgi:hypothetical protein